MNSTTTKQEAVVMGIMRGIRARGDAVRNLIRQALVDDTGGDPTLWPDPTAARHFAQLDPAHHTEEMRQLASVFPRLNALLQDLCGEM